MEKKVKKKKKLSRSAMVLMISSIIILIPCLVFGGILLISAMQNDKPVLGSRYDNDLNPAITETNTANIKSSIESLGNVESVEIETSCQFCTGSGSSPVACSTFMKNCEHILPKGCSKEGQFICAIFPLACIS